MNQQNHQSKVTDIEQQKRTILQQLKQLDEEICQIKGQEYHREAQLKKAKMIEQEQALQNAKQMIKNFRNQKKSLQLRKRKQAEVTITLMKKEEQERKKALMEQKQRNKQQKRRLIELRMEEQRKKREERLLIEKESNKLIVQLRKEEDILKQKQIFPTQIGQIQQKMSKIQKRQQVNIRQIEQHQRRYLQIKQREKSKVKERSTSISHPVQRYEKNVWSQKIEEEQFKKKQVEKIKEINKKLHLQKRLKYGELVKNIFMPKRKIRQNTTVQHQKPKTPQVVPTKVETSLPQISESEKKLNQVNQMKKFRQNSRMNSSPMNHRSNKLKIERSQEDEEKLRQQKLRELQIRRQTKQRLKKLENKSIDPLPKSPPKYQNYLGMIKVQKRDESAEWKKIIQNSKMSTEEKYNEMLKKASMLEQKARMKEETRKDGDQSAVDLYIGSIQAKLALLEKF